MELSKAREMKEAPASMANTRWLLWVDNEIWGHVSTLEDAQWFLTKISNEISKELQKENPQWKIDCVTVEDNTIKVKCTNPGYVYNSRWTAHTVRYEPIYQLIREPGESSSTRKRAPSFTAIESLDKTTKPATRPPTPHPEEKKSPSIPRLDLADIPVSPPTPPPPPPMSKAARRRFKKNHKRD